jgi:DNA helicase II / ATP-dependent DNA helicase PcrA
LKGSETTLNHADMHADMRRLDPAQAAAARGAEPVQLTLAGPGSGKTSTLTGRFVHLVRQGVDPGRILAVTYTKKAADEMAGRIARLLELPSARGLAIATFHAFAFRLLKRDPGAAGLDDGFPLWGPAEQRHVFGSRRMWWDGESDILDVISGAKERLLTPDALQRQADDDDDDELLDAVRFFRVYEEARRAAGAIDFADMVPLVFQAMESSEDYRCAVTSAYDHLLVDEYQDVNPGQIRLIDHFIQAGVKMWAVGDDDQTLYQFRASDVRYILDFGKKYPGSPIHVLDRNYRSAPEIVEAAKRVIRNNRERRDKDYKPTIAEAGEIVIRGYSTPEAEARQAVAAIAELLRNGYAPQQMAVLYRSGAVGLPFQTALKERGIPFEVRGAGDVWQGAAAKLVIGGLHYLRDGESLAAMSRLGGGKRGQIVRDQLDKVRAATRGDFAVSCIHVRRIVGEALPRQAPAREQAEWTSLIDAVIALAGPCASLEQLEMKIAEQSRSLRNPPQRAVVLSTVHSAKGLEWDVVFLAGMEDGVLPHVNAEDIEEERRIAYVGMTRAKRLLGLTYAAERFGERSRPSPFLFELTGKAERLHWWTGPNLEGADERLPLLTVEEKRRPAAGASLPAGGGDGPDGGKRGGSVSAAAVKGKTGKRTA